MLCKSQSSNVRADLVSISWPLIVLIISYSRNTLGMLMEPPPVLATQSVSNSIEPPNMRVNSGTLSASQVDDAPPNGVPPVARSSPFLNRSTKSIKTPDHHQRGLTTDNMRPGGNTLVWHRPRKPPTSLQMFSILMLRM